MGEYALGSKPEGTYRSVPAEYEPQPGEIIGSRLSGHPYAILPPGSWSDVDRAVRLWDIIRARGDEPLYVRVKTEWLGIVMTFIEIEMYLVHKTGSPGVGAILLGVAAAIAAAAWLISVVYFTVAPTEEYVRKKKAEAEAGWMNAVKLAAVVALIGIGVYVVGKAVGWEAVGREARRGYAHVKRRLAEA